MSNSEDLQSLLRRSLDSMEQNDFETAPAILERLKDCDSLPVSILDAAINWSKNLCWKWAIASFGDLDIQNALLQAFKNDSELSDKEFMTKMAENMHDLENELFVRHRILQIQQAEYDRTFRYEPDIFEQGTELDNYERVAGLLRTTPLPPAISEMVKLTKTHYATLFKRKNPIAPSFIVCSSSGTGKTQLAFSLGIPVLYFTIPTDDQNIYELYCNISSHLRMLVNDDLEKYRNFLLVEAEKRIAKLTARLQSLDATVGNDDRKHKRRCSTTDTRLESSQSSATGGMMTQSMHATPGSSAMARNEVLEETKKAPAQLATTTNPISCTRAASKLKAKLLAEQRRLSSIECYSLEFLTTSLLSKCKLAFKTPAFIISLIQNILEIRGEHPDCGWPRLQLLSDKNIDWAEITVQNASIRLKEIFLLNDGHFVDQLTPPLVFLDEFNVNSADTIVEEAEYAFMRNVIRVCGLIPVLMGTQSHIADMISSGASSSTTLSIWAYLFNKLPYYPEHALRSALNSMIGNTEFKEFLFELLHEERPLFVGSVLDKLRDFSEAKISTPFAISQYLEEIFCTIQHEFNIRKAKYMDRFFVRQLQFLEHSYQMKHDRNKIHVRPALINSHLAFLARLSNIYSANVAESYFKLWRFNHEAVIKTRTGPTATQKYVASATLPLFSESPLTCMAFSRNQDSEVCALRTNSKCYTAFQAVVEDRILAAQYAGKTSTQLDGRLLEQIVNIAFLLSNHQNGLIGTNFKHWFPYFVQQLGCYPSYKFKPVPEDINFGDNFPFLRTHIPYSAFNCAEWSSALKNCAVMKHFKVGIFSGAFQQSLDMEFDNASDDESFDSCSSPEAINTPAASVTVASKEDDAAIETFKFSDESFASIPLLSAPDSTDRIVSNQPDELQESEPDNRPMLSGKRLLVIECKLHEETLTNGAVQGIIHKLISKNLEGRFNFIVARKFSQSIKFYHDAFYEIPECNPAANKSQTTNVDAKKTVMAGKRKSRPSTSKRGQPKVNNTQKLPYNDVSIYRLIRRCESSTKMISKEGCHSGTGGLVLQPVYICADVVEKVFILIDLVEIHGNEEHLMAQLKYLKS